MGIMQFYGQALIVGEYWNNTASREDIKAINILEMFPLLLCV